jgi:hypothetical protein
MPDDIKSLPAGGGDSRERSSPTRCRSATWPTRSRPSSAGRCRMCGTG